MKAGVLAYPTCITGNWHHGELGVAFASDPEMFPHSIVLGVTNKETLKAHAIRALENTRAWIDQAQDCDVLLFSFEGFIQLDPVGWTRFREFCHVYSDKIEILVYARPAMSLAISALSQCLKQGIDTTVEGYYNVVPYRDYLEPLIDVFGHENICVRVFAKNALIQGDIWFDFLDALQLEKNVEASSHRESEVNRSLTTQGAECAEAIITYLKDQAIPYTQTWFYHKIGRKLSSIPGSKLALPDNQMELIRIVSQEHNVFLKTKFGIDLAIYEANNTSISDDNVGNPISP